MLTTARNTIIDHTDSYTHTATSAFRASISAAVLANNRSDFAPRNNSNASTVICTVPSQHSVSNTMPQKLECHMLSPPCHTPAKGQCLSVQSSQTLVESHCHTTACTAAGHCREHQRDDNHFPTTSTRSHTLVFRHAIQCCHSRA